MTTDHKAAAAVAVPLDAPVGRIAPERVLLKRDREWRDYPPGTKAHAYNGGAWLKRTDGRWQWNGHTRAPGSAFPTPGANAFGACVELPPNAAAMRHANKDES